MGARACHHFLAAGNLRDEVWNKMSKTELLEGKQPLDRFPQEEADEKEQWLADYYERLESQDGKDEHGRFFKRVEEHVSLVNREWLAYLDRMELAAEPDHAERIKLLKTRVSSRQLKQTRIFSLVTFYPSAGEQDFINVLARNRISVYKTVRIDRAKFCSEALYHALDFYAAEYQPEDIIAIVRGGGDTSDRQFDPYRNEKASGYIRTSEADKSVITISGVGHSIDTFEVDHNVLFPMLTPTDAAFKVISIISGKLDHPKSI